MKKFQIVDNCISDKHGKSYCKNEYKPKKIQSEITNMIVCGTETFNTIKVVFYDDCICRLSTLTGKNIRDITKRAYGKCKNDCIVSED